MTIGGGNAGRSFDLTLGPAIPTSSQSSSPTLGTMREEVHLVYTTVEPDPLFRLGGNAKTVTYAKMTGIDEWQYIDLVNASLAGVGITLDETNQPIIIHGYGDYDKLKRSQGKVGIYLTGWDEDGDGFANWEDDCLSEYGILNGCQDLDGDGIADTLSRAAEGDTAIVGTFFIGTFGLVIGLLAVVFLRGRYERPEDDETLVEHGIEVD